MSRLVLLIAAALWLTAAPASGAQLDPSFGGRGWMTMFQLPDGAELGEPTDVAVQPDGKILVTGPATCEQLESCFAAARLNADGTLDAGFGTGGMARHAPVRRTRASDIAVQPDGRIVLAGEWFQDGDANADDLACVMRLLPDGRLDPSFSRDGMARLDHGHGDDYLTGVAIQGRRIVVAGAGRLIEGLAAASRSPVSGPTARSIAPSAGAAGGSSPSAGTVGRRRSRLRSPRAAGSSWPATPGRASTAGNPRSRA